MDIKNTAIASSAEFHVRDAAGDPLYENGDKVTITVMSPGTKEFQRAKHAAEERSSERVMSRMQGKPDGKQSAEEKNAERAEFLAAVCVGSKNMTYNGQAVSSAEQFKAMYEDLEIGHVVEDLEKFITNRANFKKPSSKK